MTIAMATFVGSDKIISVSDARLSYGEMIPAEDAATMKSRRIAHKWVLMFAAEDATAFSPVVDKVVGDLHDRLSDDVEDKTIADHEYEAVSGIVRGAYEREFMERFFRENLSRFGYASIAEFRQNGFAEMGKDLYHQYAMALAKYDLGLELLGYGFSESGHRYIFEITNPGKLISHDLRGFAAIGSGSLMALAALNRKPKYEKNVSDMVYRLLDAKFSSETAREVGQKTYVITLESNGSAQFMKPTAIAKIREIWDKAQKQPSPKEAIEIIEDADSFKISERPK